MFRGLSWAEAVNFITFRCRDNCNCRECDPQGLGETGASLEMTICIVKCSLLDGGDLDTGGRGGWYDLPSLGAIVHLVTSLQPRLASSLQPPSFSLPSCIVPHSSWGTPLECSGVIHLASSLGSPFTEGPSSMSQVRSRQVQMKYNCR